MEKPVTIVDLYNSYEKETGQRAMYRRGSSDYHTLRYVRWIENRLLEEIKKGHSLCTKVGGGEGSGK